MHILRSYFLWLACLLPVTAAFAAAPAVSITSLTAPQNAASFVTNQNVALAATASSTTASIAKVEFFAGSTLVSTATAAPYMGNWIPTTAGSFSLTAKATDSLGTTAVSSPVSVTVTANPPPAVSLTAPAAGASLIVNQGVSLSATATGSGSATIAKVDFRDGSLLIATSTSAPYTATWTPTATGAHSLTAVATDSFGASAASAPVNLTVIDSPPPTVSLSSPAAGSTFAAPASIPLAASASAVAAGASISKVDFFQGNTLIGTASSAPYLFTFSGVPAGSYSLKAIATDSLGVQASTPAVTVTVGNLSIAFTSPQDGAAVSGTTALVQGTLQAPPNSGLTVNGVVAMIDTANKFYAQVPLQAGSNAITATVTASTGQTLTKTITLSSDGVAPLISIGTSDTEGVGSLTVLITIDGDGAIPGSISISGGAATVTPNANGLSVTYPSPGTYPTTITASDASGHVVSKSFVVVVQDPAQIDQQLKAVWNGMNNALIAGDKATAMNSLSTNAQATYGPVFDVLIPSMAGIVASFSAPQMGSASSGLSEYAITRNLNGVNNVFFLYFVKDANGVWRLDSM